MRSREYKQESYVLKNGDYYCCLGVACDISGIGKWVSDSKLGDTYVGERYQDRYGLTIEVLDWLGLVNSHNEIDLGFDEWGTDRRMLLTMANDGGCTFEQIADLIEYFL